MIGYYAEKGRVTDYEIISGAAWTDIVESERMLLWDERRSLVRPWDRPGPPGGSYDRPSAL